LEPTASMIRAVTGQGSDPISNTLRHPDQWRLAVSALAASLDPIAGARSALPESSANTGPSTGQVHRIDPGPPGEPEFVFVDNEGLAWRKEDIDRAMKLRRQLAESFDPVVKQFALDDDLLDEFEEQPGRIPGLLKVKLADMLRANAAEQKEAVEDVAYAFKLGRPGRDSSGVLRYSGIGEIARSLLQSEIGGAEPFLADAIKRAASVQDGKERALAFATLGFSAAIAILCIICPPLGVSLLALNEAADLALSYSNYQAAKQRFSALLDPELVTSRAEVEAELFALKLSSIFAALPIAGKALRLVRGLATGAKRGASLKSTLLGRSRQFQRSLDDIAEHVMTREIVVGLLTEAATDQIVGALLEKLLPMMLEEFQLMSTATARESLTGLLDEEP
ncbi:MAG: hypothetical protein AAGF12_38860, partial [Myxococcota bacterium]